jgi:predicted metal-binding membrane protein
MRGLDPRIHAFDGTAWRAWPGHAGHDDRGLASNRSGQSHRAAERGIVAGGGGDGPRKTLPQNAVTPGLFDRTLRHDRALVLSGLGAVVVLAWLYLWLGAGLGMEEMDMGGGAIMLMAPEWSLGYAGVVFVMWLVMMMAMMLPSAAPTILLVSGVARRRRASGQGAPLAAALFAVGYAVLWGTFSLAATALQWALDRAGLLSDEMAVSPPYLAGSVLVAAGLYQWSGLKEACLAHCRSPLAFLLNHWRDGGWGAVTSGLRHGLYCLGCCWALMGLLFVGGLMNLAWIAGVAVLVLVEKTLPWGIVARRLTGALLVLWGGMILAGFL